MTNRESPFKVRLAVPEDLDQCVPLALEIPKENHWAYFPKPSTEKVTSSLLELIELKTLVVYENNGVIVGVLGVEIGEFWWSEEQVLLDKLFYIKPEFRSWKAFSRMLSVAEEFAKINRLPLCMLFFTTSEVKRKFNLLKRRGFKSIGFWVIKKE